MEAFHIYYSLLLPPLFFLLCDTLNLYQPGTITVNLANVYKVQSCAAGLCSPVVSLHYALVFYAPA